MESGLRKFSDAGIQVIWQTGKSYNGNAAPEKGVRLTFISRMDMAYAAADLIISRAGALSISELCIVGKPVILVPSPNVSEDHQTKNAMTLVNEGAAVLIKDKDAVETLADQSIALLKNKDACQVLSQSIQKLARPDATEHIVNEIIGLL
jgi:UDP-N-acetylglucosamine--N-acetylmuramyl-(pentapeptide) pyrophosphoryl-undecaprenol N-acetylglucosamine transferase